MSELNRSNIIIDSQGGVHKGVSVMLNVIMMLTQDPPSPSLNENLSIMVDRLIYP